MVSNRKSGQKKGNARRPANRDNPRQSQRLTRMAPLRNGRLESITGSPYRAGVPNTPDDLLFMGIIFRNIAVIRAAILIGADARGGAVFQRPPLLMIWILLNEFSSSLTEMEVVDAITYCLDASSILVENGASLFDQFVITTRVGDRLVNDTVTIKEFLVDHIQDLMGLHDNHPLKGTIFEGLLAEMVTSCRDIFRNMSV